METIKDAPKEFIKEWEALFEAFKKHYPGIYEDQVLHPDSYTINMDEDVVVTWACAWNKTADVGRKGVVFARLGNMCIVGLHPIKRDPEGSVGMYREEDISNSSHPFQVLPTFADNS